MQNYTYVCVCMCMYVCQVVKKQFCVDLKRQKARIYSPWKGGGGTPLFPLIQIWKDETSLRNHPVSTRVTPHPERSVPSNER